MSENTRIQIELPHETLKEVEEKCMQHSITFSQYFLNLLCEKKIQEGRPPAEKTASEPTFTPPKSGKKKG